MPGEAAEVFPGHPSPSRRRRRPEVARQQSEHRPLANLPLGPFPLVTFPLVTFPLVTFPPELTQLGPGLPLFLSRLVPSSRHRRPVSVPQVSVLRRGWML